MQTSYAVFVNPPVVIHDTKCPYWNQVSLNNTNTNTSPTVKVPYGMNLKYSELWMDKMLKSAEFSPEMRLQKWVPIPNSNCVILDLICYECSNNTFMLYMFQTKGMLLGPKPFPLDRLMAIFYFIVDSKVTPTANIFSQVKKINSSFLILKQYLWQIFFSVKVSS